MLTSSHWETVHQHNPELSGLGFSAGRKRAAALRASPRDQVETLPPMTGWEKYAWGGRRLGCSSGRRDGQSCVAPRALPGRDSGSRVAHHVLVRQLHAATRQDIECGQGWGEYAVTAREWRRGCWREPPTAPLRRPATHDSWLSSSA